MASTSSSLDFISPGATGTSSPSIRPLVHKQQAGLNGLENNFDLNHAHSDDFGVSRKSSDGYVLAKIGSDVQVESTITPGAE